MRSGNPLDSMINSAKALAPARRENILVVDDTQVNLQLLMSLLGGQGYKVRPVPSGKLALSSIRASRPDLILLDINMPGLSGYEVCEALKNDPATHDIPIIFVSVKDEAQDKVKAFALGGVDYITKPFQPEEVLMRVETHLKLCQLQRNLQEQNAQLEREIRERKRSEEEVRELNRELDLRVQQRTAELELTTNELQDFLYAASHDLKTPLRGISQLVHWLSHDYAQAFDEKGKQWNELLINRVKRMDKLLDGILEYSRVGRKMRPRQPVQLQPLVARMIERLDPPEELSILFETPLPEISGEKVVLDTVFFHLIENAVKFMRPSGGQVRIGYREEASQWTFWVADNGSGIDAKYHGKIFQMFQSLHPRDDGENLGIGLALIKKILDVRGGGIWLESEVGKGCRFFFSWPKLSTGNALE
ncbi:MAG: response regulator [bacterium]|nr:response regulator [bacterium]